MKENIKVFLRIRPPPEPALTFLNTTTNSLEINRVPTTNSSRVSNAKAVVFKASPTSIQIDNSIVSYDAAYDSTSTDIYLDVEPFVQKFINGYNLSIFSYGQVSLSIKLSLNYRQIVEKHIRLGSPIQKDLFKKRLLIYSHKLIL